MVEHGVSKNREGKDGTGFNNDTVHPVYHSAPSMLYFRQLCHLLMTWRERSAQGQYLLLRHCKDNRNPKDVHTLKENSDNNNSG